MSTVAVVTGGAGGMGFATAKILGRDHHLVLTDVSRERLDAARDELASLGIVVTTVVADIADRAAVDAVLAVAVQAGRVVAVVHTAGLSPLMGSSDLVLRINALGTINVTQASLAVAEEGFALVNVASIAGHMFPRAFLPRRSYRLASSDPQRFLTKMVAAARRSPKGLRSGLAYSISKNFVIWYSAEQAGRFGEKGARILSVSPGSFDTSMGRLEVESGSERMLKYAAMKRFGEPEEIAELLAFCAGPKAGYLTGVDILCDGGTRAGIGIREMIALGRRG